MTHFSFTTMMQRNQSAHTACPRSNNTTADHCKPVREHHLTTGIIMRIEMHHQQRTNALKIATRKQSTSSPDKDCQYCSRNVAINIQSDSIVRQTKKVRLVGSIGRALHRCRKGHGFKSCPGLNFFRSYFSYQFSSVHSCEDLLCSFLHRSAYI